MAVVGLPLGLLAGDAQLRDVDDDDIIAGVDVRRVLRLMLAAQPRGNLHRQPPQDFALSVDHVPAELDLARFCRVGLHPPNREKVRLLPQKMAQLARVAPTPPREEGGGDELHAASIIQRTDAAMQYPPMLRSTNH